MWSILLEKTQKIKKDYIGRHGVRCKDIIIVTLEQQEKARLGREESTENVLERTFIIIIIIIITVVVILIYLFTFQKLSFSQSPFT
jgi:small-conductance mechanosensitive channel